MGGCRLAAVFDSHRSTMIRKGQRCVRVNNLLLQELLHLSVVCSVLNNPAVQVQPVSVWQYCASVVFLHLCCHKLFVWALRSDTHIPWHLHLLAFSASGVKSPFPWCITFYFLLMVWVHLNVTFHLSACLCLHFMTLIVLLQNQHVKLIGFKGDDWQTAARWQEKLDQAVVLKRSMWEPKDLKSSKSFKEEHNYDSLFCVFDTNMLFYFNSRAVETGAAAKPLRYTTMVRPLPVTERWARCQPVSAICLQRAPVLSPAFFL